VFGEPSSQRYHLERLHPYYARGRAAPGLVFGYGAIDEHEIREGLSRLRRALR
jgi:DNA-binding transcriptional MocR family regulator